VDSGTTSCGHAVNPRTPILRWANSVIERKPEKHRTDRSVQHIGRDFAVVESLERTDQRVGIVLRGGCDLPSAFAAIPLMADRVKGTVAIARQGTGSGLGSHRTDQILQTINGIEYDGLEEASKRLNLGEHYFSPRVFVESEFQVDGFPKFGTFPKSVVVLSIGSDLVRSVYRHKSHGYLVDPGGFWLDSLEGLNQLEPDTLRWLKTDFENLGRIDVAEFHRNLGEIVTLLRERLGAHLIVYNALVFDPGSRHHNYQLLRPAQTLRRREFNVALSDLSRTHDFHVVDIDSILKHGGVREQVDFAHFSAEQAAPIGAEFYRILRTLEVVD